MWNLPQKLLKNCMLYAMSKGVKNGIYYAFKIHTHPVEDFANCGQGVNFKWLSTLDILTWNPHTFCDETTSILHKQCVDLRSLLKVHMLHVDLFPYSLYDFKFAAMSTCIVCSIKTCVCINLIMQIYTHGQKKLYRHARTSITRLTASTSLPTWNCIQTVVYRGISQVSNLGQETKKVSHRNFGKNLGAVQFPFFFSPFSWQKKKEKKKKAMRYAGFIYFFTLLVIFCFSFFVFWFCCQSFDIFLTTV